MVRRFIKSLRCLERISKTHVRACKCTTWIYFCFSSFSLFNVFIQFSCCKSVNARCFCVITSSESLVIWLCPSPTDIRIQPFFLCQYTFLCKQNDFVHMILREWNPSQLNIFFSAHGLGSVLSMESGRLKRLGNIRCLLWRRLSCKIAFGGGDFGTTSLKIS